MLPNNLRPLQISTTVCGWPAFFFLQQLHSTWFALEALIVVSPAPETGGLICRESHRFDLFVGIEHNEIKMRSWPQPQIFP
jgi:hypothetical protein